MIRYIITVVLGFFSVAAAYAQPLFIEKATIEFEVTVNNHKSFDAWFDEDEESSWQENYKSNTNRLTTTYYDYAFANNKSVYSFKKLHDKNRSQWDNDANYEGNTWFHDFNAGTSAFKRYFWRDEFTFTDSIKELNWKMVPNESRIIAGFNCRKAYTILFDSVYVFAFYTDEITISGGPVGLHGLPGMILGVTIPRMFTSFIATRVDINHVDESLIKSPADKKTKTRKEILDKFLKRAEEDNNQWLQRNIWNFFL